MTAAVEVVRGLDTASTMLHPVRLRMLQELGQPDSATGLARRLGLPRQQANYHLRELEREGLVELFEERRKGNCIERILRATARSYLIDPAVLGRLGADPDTVRDRFSASYLVALAARAIREVASLGARAAAAGKRLPTLTLQTDLRFATAADRKAFSEELATEVARLSAKYHNEHAEGGRRFRFFLGAYPVPAGPEEDATSPVRME